VPILLRLIDLVWLVVVADAVFSWFLGPDDFPRSLTKPLLDPVYTPVRRLLQPMTGSIDLAPLVALAVLFVLRKELRPSTPGDYS
jgi:uncharacterized protein YggT (Ycf19 family)